MPQHEVTPRVDSSVAARHARNEPHELPERVPSHDSSSAMGAAMPLRLGMRFSRGLRFEQWVAIGRRVADRADASLWWLGDWLVFGSRMYGPRYERGIQLTGLDYQTLRNYAMVARRFELSRRRDTLSFHHHAEVCALTSDQQDRWLDRAEAEGWSRNELRRRLRVDRETKASSASTAVRVTVDPDTEARWRHAAKLSGSDLESWIVSTLDEAAGGVLGSDPA
jgi:hypothetical protein